VYKKFNNTLLEFLLSSLVHCYLLIIHVKATIILDRQDDFIAFLFLEIEVEFAKF